MMISKAYVFPDTNIFLHYRPLNEIDLPSMLGNRQVTLVITQIVIKELEKHKWSHPIEGIRKRAIESTKRIKEWSKTDDRAIRSKMDFELVALPAEETITIYKLDGRSQDDMLIGCALEYQKMYGVDSVFLLTADIGPQLRADGLKLKTIEPPEEHQLPHAHDAMKKENLELRRELAKYQGRSPDLALYFPGRRENWAFTIQPDVLLTQEEMEQELEERKREFYTPRKDATNSTLSGVIHLAFQQGERERYEKEFEQYLVKYDLYLHKKNELENQLRRTIKLNFVLVNTGTAFAEDVLLILRLPPKMRWFEDITSDLEMLELEMLENLEVPSPPAPPKNSYSTAMEAISFYGNWSNFMDYPGLNLPPDLFSDQSPVFKENVIEYPVGNCRHGGEGVEIEPLFAYFLNAEAVSTFEIQYQISEKNTPQAKEGRLLVKVQVKNT